MEAIYFKSDTVEPVEFLTTGNGEIDFCRLGQIMGLEPCSIVLCGKVVSLTEDLRSNGTWTQIKGALLVAGTIHDPVVVSSLPIPAVPTEGEPSSKNARDGFAEEVESRIFERFSYFEKLLEAPPELPKSAQDLRDFLATRTKRLPLTTPEKYWKINQPEYLKLSTFVKESSMAQIVGSAFDCMASSSSGSEASSSAQLLDITGFFLEQINGYAPGDRQLKGLDHVLYSTRTRASETASTALLPMLRPYFQLFVSDVLMLRWENKMDRGEMEEAFQENVSKLKVWSPLYYGMLPYVIGGCCAGRLFQWLKLSPNGERIVAENISEVYDLTMSSNVARFLHSIIRMHCLLQKLQTELGDHRPVRLYEIQRHNGGEVVIYPDIVHKVLKPELATDKFEMLRSLYASIKGSRYLSS